MGYKHDYMSSQLLRKNNFSKVKILMAVYTGY